MGFRHINQPRQEAVGPVHQGPGERSLKRFFAAMGLMPRRPFEDGQPLPQAAEELQHEPDYAADAEFIERELFVPEDRGV